MVSEEKSGPIRIHDKRSVFLGTEFQSQEKQRLSSGRCSGPGDEPHLIEGLPSLQEAPGFHLCPAPQKQHGDA